jgi:hypothetical protein
MVSKLNVIEIPEAVKTGMSTIPNNYNCNK